MYAITSFPVRDGLSDRQCGIAIELANGRLPAEIGLVMGVSKKTVEYHKAEIIKKLQIKTEPYSFLAKFMMKLGYIN